MNNIYNIFCNNSLKKKKNYFKMIANSENYNNLLFKFIKDRVESERNTHNELTKNYKNKNIEDEIMDRLEYITKDKKYANEIYNICSVKIYDTNNSISRKNKRKSYSNIQNIEVISEDNRKLTILKQDIIFQNSQYDLMEKGEINIKKKIRKSKYMINILLLICFSIVFFINYLIY